MRRSTATGPSSPGTVPEGFPLKVTPLVDRTPRAAAARCSASSATTTSSPAPSRWTSWRRRSKAAGKTYEFHRYDGAGHAFFSVDRPAYRPEAAVDGWQRIFEWYGRYLAGG